MATVLVDTRHGPMWVFEEDGGCSRMLREYGEYSENELAVMRSFISPDSIVVDAGAHIGAFTIPLARMCKKVYAIEPQTAVIEVLRDNLTLNDIHNVEVLPCAVGHQRGRMFYTPDPLAQGSVVLKKTGQESTEVIPLDELDLPPVDFIKSDVEGMDLNLLAGGMTKIMSDRPYMLIERLVDHSDLVKGITMLAYRNLFLDLPMYVPNNWKSNPHNHYSGKAHLMVLAIPQEK